MNRRKIQRKQHSHFTIWYYLNYFTHQQSSKFTIQLYAYATFLFSHIQKYYTKSLVFSIIILIHNRIMWMSDQKKNPKISIQLGNPYNMRIMKINAGVSKGGKLITLSPCIFHLVKFILPIRLLQSEFELVLWRLQTHFDNIVTTW